MTPRPARAFVAILTLSAALAACSPAPATPTQPVASETPLPPAATLPPSPTPTATPVTMPYGGGTIVYAHAEKRGSGVQLTLVSDGEAASLQVETDSSPGLVAISPDGAHVALELVGENTAHLYWVDFTITPATATDLGRLPGQAAVEQVTFSPDRLWFAVTYDANSQGSNPAMRVRLFNATDLAFKDIESCGGVYAFSVDSIQIYCSTTATSVNVPEPFAYNLESGARTRFLNIPPLKQDQQLGRIFYPVWLSPQHNQALWADFATYYLDSDLQSRMSITSWTNEELIRFTELPYVVAFSSFPRVQRVAWSPDGSSIMLAGVAGGSTQYGTACMAHAHYTAVASLAQPYTQPAGDQAPNGVFAFAWSPNQAGLLAMVMHGEQCQLSVVDALTLEEMVAIDSLNDATLRNSRILGVDAIWLP